MVAYLMLAICCLLLIAVVTVYVPTVLIREMNKAIKVLQQIE